ncbi:hypothetical protein F4677DRAFT_150970 [Hypoxylon crocopeplum]|nr:hypothetical protein F4677DRAFT_150970 [Hypoxylon crocopeplum]
MYYTSDSCLSSPQKWDPEAVLRLINRSTGTITCIGYAHTRGRRCQNRVARHKIAYARGTLNKLAGKSASKAAQSPELGNAADILLCWQHTSQSSDTFRQWRSSIEDWAIDHENAGSRSKSDADIRSFKKKPHVKKEAAADLSAEELRRVMNQMKENLDRLEAELRQKGGKHMKHESTAKKPVPQETREERETERQREEDVRRRERERERREQERREQERREQERKEEERRKQKRKEQERREQEQRRREEERRREEDAREEAFRERVRLAKEKRERDAREKAERETAEWHESWERYFKAWNKKADLSAANIPWPVKSGLQADVNEDNIRLFFEKAPPEQLVDSGEKCFKLISAENKRWHTDKMIQRFGQDVVNGAARSTLGTVAKIVIELRQEAQANR